MGLRRRQIRIVNVDPCIYCMYTKHATFTEYVQIIYNTQNMVRILDSFFENQVSAVWARTRRTIVIGRNEDSARILKSGFKFVN